MNFSTYRFTLDLQKHQSQMSIATFQYDTAVKLSIGLTDGGVPYYLEDGCIAVLWGKKANGEPISHKCSIESNTKIIYEFNKETADEIGIVDCQIRLYKDGEEKITAPKFIIVVAERVTNDAEVFDAGDGAFEEQFSALDNLFTQESGRVIAENARVEAEEERRGNELVRKENEQSRIDFETQRRTDETIRGNSEDERKEAEKKRQEQFDNIKKSLKIIPTEGLSYTLSSDGTYYEVSGIGTATDTDIIIANEHEGLPVKGIRNGAFFDNRNIRSVTMPDTITSIGERAFYWCFGLEDVTMSKNVTSIGGLAFGTCQKLKQIVIPESVTFMGSSAFNGCAALSEINFRATSMSTESQMQMFTDIGKDGVDIIIGENVTCIPKRLFQLYGETFVPKFTRVIFEKGSVCKTIDKEAFYGHTNLTDIIIPKGVITIGRNAFTKCNLIKAIIPSSVEVIEAYVFGSKDVEIYCEASSKPNGWDASWNTGIGTVIWGVPLDFPGVNEKLEKYKSESKEYADGIKNDLLNGAGPAYDTLKELGDALEENKGILDTLASKKFLQDTLEEYDMTVVQKINETSDSLVAVTTNPDKIYGTDENGNQTVYPLGRKYNEYGIALRQGGGFLSVPNPTQPWHSTSKEYVDKVKAQTEALEERVADLENLTLSHPEITSTDYEKAVPADVGKPARIKMIGGATKKVSATKNILNPRDMYSFYATDPEHPITYEYNNDGTITYTIGYDGYCSFSLWNFPAGRYYLYLENASIIFLHEADVELSLDTDYNPETNPDFTTCTKTLKVMVWQDTSVTTDTYEIVEAPEGTVFEPYIPTLQDAEVERIESVGADGETLLGSIAIPFEAIKTKIDGFGKAVNDTYYDYIEFVDDKVFGYKVADEIVLNGTEAWQNNGSTTSENNYFLTIVTSDKTKYIKDQALSDRYDYCKLTSSNKDTGINGYVSNAFGGFAVGVRPPNVTSYNPTSFRAFVKENPITVRLARTTPEVTDITDLFTENNKLQVQRGGAIRFVNERKMAIPNTVAFIKRKE